MSKSYAPQVVADASGKFFGNALRFATREEAWNSARDLAKRWTLVTDFRAAETTDCVTHRYIDGQLLAAEQSITRETT